SPPTDCTRKPNLTERLYEEEKRRTNALLIQVFQQTARETARLEGVQGRTLRSCASPADADFSPKHVAKAYGCSPLQARRESSSRRASSRNRTLISSPGFSRAS